jgi:Uma2 family endonuclease
MTALLDLPEVRDRIHRVSVSEYHRLGELGLISEKVELLRGIIVDKMSKSPLREYISQKLLMLLLRLIPNGFEVRPERPLTTIDSEPEPDISVVQGKPEDWLHGHPSTASLVIEVSMSSLLLDRSKATIYAEAKVPEYWLIRAEERIIEIYREPSEKGYGVVVTLSEGDVVPCSSIPNITFKASEIFPKT